MTMQKRKLNNQELDAIGKRLFAASRLTESEIERIASASGSFERVLTQIRNAETSRDSGRTGFGQLLGSHRLMVGTALAAVLCVSIFALILKQNGSDNVVFVNPVERPGEARPNFTPQVKFVKGFTSGRADIEPDPLPETPSVINTVQRETRRSQPRVDRASYTPGNENHFVAVTYTGDGGESARGGRVVRVDVPRSTLFAMGFDVSLENDSPTVKADLLIGPDGVTRAVRLVE